MENNREQLLQKILENFSKIAHSMHSDECFPLGNTSLTKQQFAILFFLFENKGQGSVKDVSAFLKVTPGAVTQFVDRLVRSELVERTENPLDKRSVIVKLTENTRKQFNKIKKSYLISASKIFSPLNNQELFELINLLQKIEKPIKKTPL